MILPIVAYGNPVLRKLASPISPDYPQLEKLLEDMWETMYESSGVGLAAPQINKPIRLFIIDTAQMFENMNEDERKEFDDSPGDKLVFINAPVSYTHLRAHETVLDIVCRLLLEKKKETFILVESCTIE